MGFSHAASPRRRAGELETHGQLAVHRHFGLEEKGVGQTLDQFDLHEDRLAGPHHALETHVVHARGDGHSPVGCGQVAATAGWPRTAWPPRTAARPARAESPGNARRRNPPCRKRSCVQTIRVARRSRISSTSRNGSRCGMAARISWRVMTFGRGAACEHCAEKTVDVVGHDHAVVDRPQPAGHDNPHAAGMIQAGDLLGQAAADGQALELRAEAGPVEVLGVMLEGQRRGALDPVQLAADVGHVLRQGVQRRFDQGPVCRPGIPLPAGRPNRDSWRWCWPRSGSGPAGPRLRIIERIRAAGDVAAQAAGRCGTRGPWS